MNCEGCIYDPATSGSRWACIHPNEAEPGFWSDVTDYSCKTTTTPPTPAQIASDVAAEARTEARVMREGKRNFKE